MSKKSIFLLCVLVLTVASGCSLYHIDSEEVSTTFYTPKASVQDVTYVESVTRPHEIIGFVTVNAERNKKMQEVIDQMRREAAVLGGDAITNITTNATGIWKKIPAQQLTGNAYVRANFTATVVVYK